MFSFNRKSRKATTRYTPAMIESLQPLEIFVFGSNNEGRHLAGAAKTAQDKFGAVWGNGHGFQGQSYAVDTMSGIDAMRKDIRALLKDARKNARLTFLVTELGCGIAGYTPEQVAPMLKGAPSNVILPERFAAVL